MKLHPVLWWLLIPSIALAASTYPGFPPPGLTYSTSALLTALGVPTVTSGHNGVSMSFTAGDGNGTNQQGGDISYTAGQGFGSQRGGDLNFTAGKQLFVGSPAGRGGNINFSASQSNSGNEGIITFNTEFGSILFGIDVDNITPASALTFICGPNLLPVSGCSRGSANASIQVYNTQATDQVSANFNAVNDVQDFFIHRITSSVNTTSPLSGGPTGEQANLYTDSTVPICVGTAVTNSYCVSGSDQGLWTTGATGASKGTGTWNVTHSFKNGVEINPSLSGLSGSIGGSALVAGACSSGTVTVTGTTTSMVPRASPNTYPGDGFSWEAYMSAANTVTVKVCATIAGTPTASTYNVRVLVQ